MIGAGNIANTHLASYANVENTEIYAICDINEARLNETVDKYGITIIKILDAIYESARTGHEVLL